MKIMGTGSRAMITDPHARELYEKLRGAILAQREKTPNLVLISGMAEGMDEAIAKIGMRESIPYIAAIPSPGYGEYYWRDHSVTGKNRYATYLELVDHAATALIVSQKLYVYVNGVRTHANFIRNQWMVDNCDAAIVFNPTSSGTRDAVRRLDLAKKPYFILEL